MREFRLNATVDAGLLGEVTQALLGAIFFHRLFGVVRPAKERELLNVSFPGVEDPVLQAAIADKVAAFLPSMLPAPATAAGLEGRQAQTGQVVVSFLEKQTRKAWFSKSELQVAWEEWVLDMTALHPRTEAERAELRRSMEADLRHLLLNILTLTDEYKDHIPPITTSDANPFPYQISIPANDSWGAVLKKLAQPS